MVRRLIHSVVAPLKPADLANRSASRAPMGENPAFAHFRP
jgi:hypothetical protein